MADARATAAWNRTAAVLAMLFNVNRDPKKSPALKPRDFHPMLHRQEKLPKVGIGILKAVFVDPLAGSQASQGSSGVSGSSGGTSAPDTHPIHPGEGNEAQKGSQGPEGR